MRRRPPGVGTEGFAGPGEAGSGEADAAAAAQVLRPWTCPFSSLSGPCRFSRRSRSPRRAWPRGRCSGPPGPSPPAALPLPWPVPALPLGYLLRTLFGTRCSPRGCPGSAVYGAQSCLSCLDLHQQTDLEPRGGLGTPCTLVCDSGTIRRQKELAFVPTGSRRPPW